MKRFEFRLEQVRKWRQDQAELEEMRLQQLVMELCALEARQSEIAADAERSRRGVVEQAAVTGGDLAALEALHDYVEQEMSRLKQKQLEVKKRIEEQRKRLLEAHRRFQLLDALRGKALTAWTAGCDKEQEELAAEVHLAKRVREKGAGF